MAWEDNLQDCSFKGVTFPVLSVEDRGGHDVVQHAYPYRDGVETEDQGLKAGDFQISAFLWGDEYENDLADLLAILKETEPGELIHPVYGSLNCQVLDWRVRHDADGVDQCHVDIYLIEADEPEPIFQTLNPRQSAAAVVDSDAAVTDAVTEAWVADVAEPSLISQLAKMRTVLQGTISEIYGKARGLVHSALDVINYPRIMVSDLIQGVGSILQLAESLDPDKIFQQWRSLADDAKALLTIPEDIARDESTPPTRAAMRPINRLVSVAVVSQYAATVGELLASEAESATLSPPQIETMVGDVRAMIETLVLDLRDGADLDTADKLLRYRPVVEALKDQALMLQEAAQAIIELRPPMIERTVVSAGNLHLIAHRWYGDYSRAAELLRLNPQIRQPNFVPAGTVLLAYAA